MNLNSFLVVALSFFSYGLLTFALVKEYATTFPYCLNDNDNERCIPCPDNAKCIETEIQCDERYVFQRGQCLPVHLVDTTKQEDLANNYQKENPTPKRIFLTTIEVFATCSLFIFVFVQIRQTTNPKDE
ncbi:hypothetical protein M9Y10_032771 [Tritrichomonas musculus]|uniref:Uncharacterized protein n=1 Tax=Tritrichomonas musculus TaxID=1915356 RepID=A0ABR2GXS3_9EUKA